VLTRTVTMQQLSWSGELRSLTVQQVIGHCRGRFYAYSSWNCLEKLQSGVQRPSVRALDCIVCRHAKNVECQTSDFVRVGKMEEREDSVGLNGGDNDDLHSLDSLVQKLGIHSANSCPALKYAIGEEELLRRSTAHLHPLTLSMPSLLIIMK